MGEASRSGSMEQGTLTDTQRVFIFENYNCRFSAPPVYSGFWSSLDWAKHVGDKELTRAQESGERL